MLRGELGFGVIFTDALNMEGVRKKYGDGEVAVPRDPGRGRHPAPAARLRRAPTPSWRRSASSRIAPRLNASAERILALKRELASTTRGPSPPPVGGGKLLKTAEHRAVARRITTGPR